jgi:hypothetical protein
MARLRLGEGWACGFATDFDPVKPRPTAPISPMRRSISTEATRGSWRPLTCRAAAAVPVLGWLAGRYSNLC